MRNLDGRAIRLGVSVALMVAIPAVVLNEWLTRDGRESGATGWLFLLSLLGWVWGGGVAAWVQQRRLPYSHGIVASVLAYLIPQAVLVVLNLLGGDGVNVLRIAFSLSIVALAGVIGGALGSSLQRRGAVPSFLRDQP